MCNVCVCGVCGIKYIINQIYAEKKLGYGLIRLAHFSLA